MREEQTRPSRRSALFIGIIAFIVLITSLKMSGVEKTKNDDITAGQWIWRRGVSMSSTIPIISIKVFNAITEFMIGDVQKRDDMGWGSSNKGKNPLVIYDENKKVLSRPDVIEHAGWWPKANGWKKVFFGYSIVAFDGTPADGVQYYALQQVERDDQDVIITVPWEKIGKGQKYKRVWLTTGEESEGYHSMNGLEIVSDIFGIRDAKTGTLTIPNLANTTHPKSPLTSFFGFKKTLHAWWTNDELFELESFPIPRPKRKPAPDPLDFLK